MIKEKNELKGKKIAILAANGFEEIELTAPKEELESHGATVHILSGSTSIKSWDKHEWGKEFHTDGLLNDANTDDYDMLVLPGGVINGDRLRRDQLAIGFIKAFSDEKKPIAAICHGPQLLIEADIIRGRSVTSHRAIATDMKNAGADYQETGVARDDYLITARGPDDIPGFMKMIFEALTMSKD